MVDASLKRLLDSKGLCRDPKNRDLSALFFADSPLERRPARNLCGSCPVKRECLYWALETKSIWGVWGGCDEADLRRALWVDASGEPIKRNRFPQCPNCKARPSKLVVVKTCDLSRRRIRERVECVTCGFTWSAATSVSAVKTYWRQRNALSR